MRKLILVAVIVLMAISQVNAVDLKLPWPSGEAWQVTVQYGGYCGSGCQDDYHTDVSNAYYAIDFDDPNALPGDGRPILAAARVTLYMLAVILMLGIDTM